MRRGTAEGGLDRFGAFASTACAVHCLLAAALPSALAAVGLGALLGHEAEWALTGAAVVFAVAALSTGWRHHRSWAIAATFGVGVAGLGASRVLEELHVHGVGIAIGVAAGVALVVGHVASFRACRACRADNRDRC
ncbi:MAG TPA: MerC domain-containing protein [Sandaracinaceae bacterium LLY-WYZ-13_1]|nr:MerC domain-containing protein [Sandaracinaceae bacterium LLY-WYZ-13_1]